MDIVLKVLVRGGDKAYIDGDGLAPADARYFALTSKTRSSTLCISSGISAISSRNSVPPSACSNFALRAGTARPGERSADIAEQLAAYEVARDRGTVYGYKGFVPAVGCVMDGVGEKLFFTRSPRISTVQFVAATRSANCLSAQKLSLTPTRLSKVYFAPLSAETWLFATDSIRCAVMTKPLSAECPSAYVQVT